MFRGRVVLSFALALGLASGLPLVLGVPQSAEAAAAAKKVGAKVGPPLQEAQKLFASKKFGDGMKKIQEAEAVPGKTSYEDYMIAELKAYGLSQQGKYGEAAKAYEATVASGEMGAADVAKRQVLIAQLYVNANNTAKALEYGNKALKNDPNDVELQVLVGQAYYQQKDYPNAIKLISGAISAQERAGRAPKENWLQILLSSQYKQNNTEGYNTTLEKLVRTYPKKEYWSDLGIGLMKTPGIKDGEMLDIYRLMIEVGAVKDAKQYTDIAELAMLKSFPNEAKAALDKGYAGGLLGKSADAAREKRLLDTATAKAAADLQTLPQRDTAAQAEPTGKADVMIGETYLGLGQYQNAVTALDRGIKKGGGEDPAAAKLHLAQAYAKANQKPKAIALLKEISATKGVTGNLARLWILHLS